jgi:hypothetical protein
MPKKQDIDNKTAKLSNQIRELLGNHLLDVEHTEKEKLTSCLIALCVEIARLRWLCVSTEEVKEEAFDETFIEGMMKHYEENRIRYGVLN